MALPGACVDGKKLPVHAWGKAGSGGGFGVIRLLAIAATVTCWCLPALVDAGPRTLSELGRERKGRGARIAGESCSTDADCADGNGCTTDICFDSQCVHKGISGCTTECDIDLDCFDMDPCTTDLCVEMLCEHEPREVCCESDADCDDGDGCTTDTCIDGQCRHEQLEACTSCGFAPTCSPIEVVFVFDTSGSLVDEGDAICDGINSAVASLAAEGVHVIPHFLGITEIPQVGFDCITTHVAGEFGFAVPGDAQSCGFTSGLAPSESWGPATAIVADRFSWTDGAARLVVPVSDEAPCHGTIPGGCNDPGDDRDSANNAVTVALQNNVMIAPVLGSNRDACGASLAEYMATATGGRTYLSDVANDDIPGLLNDLLVDGCTTSLGDPCDDGNACTDDACNAAGQCENILNFDPATSCCNPADALQSVLDDGDDCTNDVCDAQTGVVTHSPATGGTLCDDGNACTVADVCDGEGTCMGTLRNCDDGVPCTSDSCDPATGLCMNEAVDAACDNGVFCDGLESCDAAAGCVSDAGFTCDDDNACTDDSCDDGGDTCVHTPNYDTATECCNPSTGESVVIDDGSQCTVDVCDSDTGAVQHVSHNNSCDDGNACTTNDSCSNGVCAGEPVLCFDGIGCTVDACDMQTGQCTYTPDNALCDDGSFCNGVEVCGLLTDCMPGTPPSCDDDIACTQDSCDEAANACVHEADDSACDNGVFCDGAETCDVQEGCLAGSTPTCDDQIACTVDTCSPNTDGCLHVPVHELCKDGVFCNGTEVCDPVEGCIDGPDPDCSDGIDCTLDVCHEEDRECKNLPIDVQCNNGVFCDGDEVCDPSLGCLAGPTRDCDDGNACTIDFCDNDADDCSHELTYDPALECCDPSSGDVVSLFSPETCMVGQCHPETGLVSYSPAAYGTPCSDAAQCTGPDICDGLGTCRGEPINGRACQSDADCDGLYCDQDTGTCICSRELCIDPVDGQTCRSVGEAFQVDIRMGFGPQVVVGGQFVIPYDPSVLELVEIVPGNSVDQDSPFALEIFRDIDTNQGLIVYSVGIIPGNMGSQGPDILASMTFMPLETCAEQSLCYISENPLNTLLTDDVGNKVPFELCCPGTFTINDGAPVLVCPESRSVNPSPGGLNANVTWESAVAVDGCEDVAVTCQASHSMNFEVDNLISNGGSVPFGTSTFACEATDSCGATSECEWTIEVSGQNEVNASVQMSPSMASGPLQRCITFEFFSSCVEAPYVAEMALNFGLPYELPGVSMDQVFSVPAGQYFCVTARDSLHTLRSASSVTVDGNRFMIEFIGDPGIGGNWLRAGNLDQTHVVDVYDFMVFWDEEFKSMDPNNTCGTAAPHADINGDGIVDSLDFDMISNHYLQEDQVSCCGGNGVSASGVAPVTRVSIDELYDRGLEHLSVGDLTGDGWIDGDDIEAYRQGSRPDNGHGKTVGR